MPPQSKKIPNDTLHRILTAILALQEQIQHHLVLQLASSTASSLAGIAHHAPSDTIYTIDQRCDQLILDRMELLARDIPLLLIAEGISEEAPLALPAGIDQEDCLVHIILDPIDGTRMLMYDKRSAWTLAGVAPNLGEPTNLQDIQLAVMTELPTSKQTYTDTLYAIRGEGVRGWRKNLQDGSQKSWHPAPSQARNLEHGFAQLTKFFPGRKGISTAIEEDLFKALGAFENQNRCLIFDDQYLSTGGQIYELIAGHDRFQADLRAALRRLTTTTPSPPPGMACHPYDFCVELIAREAGVIITNLSGAPVSCPLDTTYEVDWIAYANRDLQAILTPILNELFIKYGLVG